MHLDREMGNWCGHGWIHADRFCELQGKPITDVTDWFWKIACDLYQMPKPTRDILSHLGDTFC